MCDCCCHLECGLGHKSHVVVALNRTLNPTQGEAEASVHHARKLVTTTGLDFQTVGQDHLWCASAAKHCNPYCRQCAAADSLSKLWCADAAG